ncbi:MAG: hypothetical protein HQL69_12360 [Magnetococcales bacterium]|nr:hypothetical protein [Magnetococcales bacterium]
MKFTSLLENIVANPLRATLTVGFSILALNMLIFQLSLIWSQIDFLHYIVPFIPPYFITRTAKRINERQAEYDFIQDAAPYIFVAFPEHPTVESLLESRTVMVSQSTAKHLNQPIETILSQPPLAPEYLVDSNKRLEIVEFLVKEFHKNSGTAVLENYHIELQPFKSDKSVSYLLNSVLKQSDKSLKWQATLTRLDMTKTQTNI